MSRLWLTGYRSYELGVFGNEDPKLKVIQYALKNYLIEKIETGVTWLITGGQLGIEQWVIEAGADLKEQYPEFKIAMMLPFKDFGSNWNENNQAKLAQIKLKADFVETISAAPYESPQQLRNYQTFMLSHTELAGLVYDIEKEGKPEYDYQAIQKYMDRQPYDLEMLDFDWLQEKANEFEENSNNGFQPG